MAHDQRTPMRMNAADHTLEGEVNGLRIRVDLATANARGVEEGIKAYIAAGGDWGAGDSTPEQLDAFHAADMETLYAEYWARQAG